jgi:hypothetical protein
VPADEIILIFSLMAYSLYLFATSTQLGENGVDSAFVDYTHPFAGDAQAYKALF